MTPKVSVILCTYNAEKYIEDTLQSIVDQSYTAIEILILDNNSSDHTLDILQKLVSIQEKSDKRVQVFPSKKNL